MIVPMKKAVLIVQSKDSDYAIGKLRSLGIVHVWHQQTPKGKDLNQIQEDINLVNTVIEILSEKNFLTLKFALEIKNHKDSQQKKMSCKSPSAPLSAGLAAKSCGVAARRADFAIAKSGLKESLLEKRGELNDWKFTAKHLIDLNKRQDQLNEYAIALKNRISYWEGWGDFDPEKIEQLAGKDVHIRFYQIPVKEIKFMPSEVIVKIIFNKGPVANCLVISRGLAHIGFKELSLPKVGLSTMRQKLEEDNRVLQTIKQELSNQVCFREDFITIKKRLLNQLQFQEALRGMGQSGSLLYLAGFIPYDQTEAVLKMAKEEKFGLVLTDPSEEDAVPTLICNPKWVSLINPVFSLLEVIPGYRELDVSPLFLLFLALFFGMIIGDAGYGVVYFALTFLAHQKFGSKIKDKTVFFLFYLFSFCAIIWGLLTGTVFGQQWYLAAGFKALLPALNNAKVIMSFCFFLGAVQLSLGHGWQALAKLPSIAALADIGFICLLWVGFLLAKMFILGEPFPVIGKWLAWAGIILIILFVSPQKNILKGIGTGLGTLALGIMGNFGDVVSYIRLFAVGLAGVAVADSVNMLAAGAGGNIVAQALILFVGHSINIILGPMSVLVHGIRLNILEFSLLHGNVTWSGLTYKPLKEI